MAFEQPHRIFTNDAETVLKQRADSLARESFEEEATDQMALLHFRIGEEWYAVKVADVREIFQEYDLTPIPGVPDHVLGVVNVRGEILSVTDPARMMRLGTIEGDGMMEPPAIVIVKDDVVTAMVVDEIGDIFEVDSNSIEPPVSIIDRAQAEFIAGSVCTETGMIGLVSIDKVLEPVTTGNRH